MCIVLRIAHHSLMMMQMMREWFKAWYISFLSDETAVSDY